MLKPKHPIRILQEPQNKNLTSKVKIYVSI